MSQFDHQDAILTLRELTSTRISAWTMSVIALFVMVSSAAAAGDPALPGHHPLSQIQAGRLLIDELRCAACHAGVAQGGRYEKTAPQLNDVGARVSPDFLRSFLASPATAHPGTTMPDILGSRSDSEKRLIAESLTHFLVAQSSPASSAPTTESIDRNLGNELFHTIGCVACHGPREIGPDTQKADHDEEDEVDIDPEKATRKAIKVSAVPLGHVSAKYSVGSLSEFLFQPLKVRSSGRMPDMKLTPAESLAIAGYLVGEQKTRNDSFVPKAELVEAGRKHFQALNCVACHTLAGFEDASIDLATKSELKHAEAGRGCLSTTLERSRGLSPTGNSPRFELDMSQVSAIVAAIHAGQAVESDNDQLAMTLTAFRCINCHVRDDYGGVHDAHRAFFKGSQLKLGDDGRIPPPLSLMGAKLQSAWLKKVLFDGESVRHYMSTRMPQYGENNLSDLPALFHRLDSMTGPEMNLPNPESRDEVERKREKLMRTAGRELLGDKGANCVACHNFNGKAASANQGIDLLTTGERLQPAWFQRYLQYPGSFRPRTVMPSAWPDGVAAFTTILEGDTNRQIEAIWYYLSLGTSAADPSGVRDVGTAIAVADRAVIHRGRSKVAGFRGIAVGLPEKLSYAFNAETGTLSAIWQGEFVNVNWSGQGSGDFHPASPSIQLAQDVSFALLEDDDSPWPQLPLVTKEAPTNPNPLYPKNVGYQFRGYFLDEWFIPTFQYRIGSMDIEDRSSAIASDGSRVLQRVLKFDSATPQIIWFRALVGDIQKESDQVFRSDRLQLTVPRTETRMRALSGESREHELLLRLQIPQGKSTMELRYEPLNQ